MDVAACHPRFVGAFLVLAAPCAPRSVETTATPAETAASPARPPKAPSASSATPKKPPTHEPEDTLDPDPRLDVPDVVAAPIAGADLAIPREMVPYRVCIRYQPDYDDIHGGEDWWMTASEREARGIRIRITAADNSIGDDLFYGYVNAETGCTPTMLVKSSGRYGIRAYSQARISDPAGNFVDVHQPVGSHSRYWIQLTSNAAPGNVSYVWTNNAKYQADVVNVAAVVGHALNKRYGGLDGEEFHVYPASCRFAPGQGSCYEDDASDLPGIDSGDALFLSGGARRRKFVIAHEVGHAVAAKQEEPPAEAAIAPWHDPKCNERGASSHELTSKEHQSTAAKEGFAHFYAATIWNDRLQKDCAFAYYKSVDHDLDGTPTTDPWVSCEDGADFLTKAGCAEEGFANEWDWMRFWWDLHTDADVSFVDIAEIWAQADTHTWNTVHDPTRSADAPFARIRTAFRARFPTNAALQKAFDTYANFNGVNR